MNWVRWAFLADELNKAARLDFVLLSARFRARKGVCDEKSIFYDFAAGEFFTYGLRRFY